MSLLARAECWREVGNFLAGAKTIQTLEIHDEDIDEDSIRAMATGDARWTADLKRLSFSRCERFKTAGRRQRGFRGRFESRIVRDFVLRHRGRGRERSL